MMSERDLQDFERRLSPAASAALDEMLRHYRLRLLESVASELRGENVTASELIRSIDSEPTGPDTTRTLGAAASAQYSAGRSWREMALLSGFASVVVLSALVFLAFQALLYPSLEYRREVVLTGGLVVSSVLFVLSYVGALFALKQSSASRSRARELEYQLALFSRRGSLAADLDSETLSHAELPGMFLEGWRRIEAAITRLSERGQLIEAGVHPPLGRLITELTVRQQLTPEDEKAIRTLLRLRNSLVHGDDSEKLSAQDVTKARMMAERLERKAGGGEEPTS